MVTNKRWLDGPSFLMKHEVHWQEQHRAFIQNEEVNYEVDVNVTSIDQSAATINTLIEYYSNWSRLKKAVAIFRRVQKILQQRILQREIVLHTDLCEICAT